MLYFQSSDPLRVGVLGFGYWGPTLARNFAQTPNAQLVAICDVRAESRLRARQLHAEIDVFDTFEQMLMDSRLDAIAIATPSAKHHHFAKRALEHGLHVIVEKPMTLCSAEAEELVLLAQEKGLTLMVDHTHLYSSAFSEISSLLNSEELGELRYVSCQRRSLGLFQNHMNVVWDLAPHDLSILTYLFGEMPETISCRAESVMGGLQEDVASLSLAYSDGRFATIQNSWIEPKKVREITLVGSRKMAIFDDLETTEKLRIYDKRVDLSAHQQTNENQYSYWSGDCTIPQLSNYEPVLQMCQHFVTCCLTGQAPKTCGHHALSVIRLLETADRSLAGDGQPQRPLPTVLKQPVAVPYENKASLK